MTRITKQIAHEVAGKLLQSKMDKYKEMQSNHDITIDNYVFSHLPDDLKAAYQKYPEYFKKGCRVYYQSQVIGHSNIPYKESIFHITDHKQGDKLMKSWNTYHDYYKSIRGLNDELIISLQNLRTYNKVREHFPEAAEYLPKDGNAQIAVNTDDLIKKLKSL